MPYKDKRKTQALIRKWKIRNKEKLRLQAQEYHRATYVPHPRILMTPEALKRSKALQDKRYREVHADKIKRQKRKYYLKNRTRIIAKITSDYQNNLNMRLALYLRTRIGSAIRHRQKAGSAVRDLGCSIEQFKMYITKKFQIGMTWANHGKWHLDHIQPLCKFDLSNREQFLKAAHFSNYQPLWAADNLAKGGR